MTHQELTAVYEKIKSLCISYGSTNIGSKALSKYLNIPQKTIKECINELLKTGALISFIDENHFLPHETSVGWDGSEPHRTQTRYFKLPDGQ